MNCGIKWSHPSLDWNCRATAFAWEHIRIVLLGASWLIGCLRMKKHLQGNLKTSFLSDRIRTAYTVQAIGTTAGPFSKCCDMFSENFTLTTDGGKSIDSLVMAVRELKQRRWQCQQERQKSKRFRQAKQQICTWVMLFCTFLCRQCTTTTWKCLISCFVEDVNTRRRLVFFSWPLILCFRIQLQKKLPTFNKLKEME